MKIVSNKSTFLIATLKIPKVNQKFTFTTKKENCQTNWMATEKITFRAPCTKCQARKKCRSVNKIVSKIMNMREVILTIIMIVKATITKRSMSMDKTVNITIARVHKNNFKKLKRYQLMKRNHLLMFMGKIVSMNTITKMRKKNKVGTSTVKIVSTTMTINKRIINMKNAITSITMVMTMIINMDTNMSMSTNIMRASA